MLRRVGGFVQQSPYYSESNSLTDSAKWGALFGGAGYVGGDIFTWGIRQFAKPFIYVNTNPKVPILFQGTPNPAPVLGGTIGGSILQGGSSFIPGTPAKDPK